MTDEQFKDEQIKQLTKIAKKTSDIEIMLGIVIIAKVLWIAFEVMVQAGAAQ